MDDMHERIRMFFVKSVKSAKISTDYNELFVEINEELKKNLNQEEQGLLLNYTDAYSEYIEHCMVEYFKRGFWVGCEMMRELSDI